MRLTISTIYRSIANRPSIPQMNDIEQGSNREYMIESRNHGPRQCHSMENIMSNTCEAHMNVKPKAARSVRTNIYDRRREDHCNCQRQCWLVQNSPSLLSKYSSEQLLSVVKCNQLYQIQGGSVELKVA